MINKILTTIFCLSSLVCGTAEAKKKGGPSRKEADSGLWRQTEIIN